MMLLDWEKYTLVIISYIGIYFLLVDVTSSTYTFPNISLVADIKDTKIESLGPALKAPKD